MYSILSPVQFNFSTKPKKCKKKTGICLTIGGVWGIVNSAIIVWNLKEIGLKCSETCVNDLNTRYLPAGEEILHTHHSEVLSN